MSVPAKSGRLATMKLSWKGHLLSMELDIAWKHHMMEEEISVAGSLSASDLLAGSRGLEIGRYECLVGGHG